MRPYYEHDGITIYHGDCREILPTVGQIDCVVTDPPYCSGGFSESGKSAAKGMGLRSETIRDVGWFVNDNMTTQGIAWLMSHVAGWCFRQMADGGTFTAFTDWRMLNNLAPAIESSGFRYQQLLVWKKPNPGLGVGFRAQHELAMHFAKGTGKYYSFDHGNVIESKRVNASDREHQTQKPLDLIETILTVVSEAGKTVVDPFMGSGTTLHAAKNLRRKAIGIEISERYCEVAAKRISQMVLPL